MSLDWPALEKTLEIRYNGIYDLDGLYRMIREWLYARRYDYMEGINKDKTAGPFGNEVEWEMYPEIKIDEFIKYKIEIKTKFYDVKEFEAVIDGQKKKVNNGKFWIKINGKVEFDYRDKFEKKPLHRHMREFLIKKLFKRYYEIRHVDHLTHEIFRLHAEIKKFLKMEASFNAYQ
jgi:hypothetical protein